MSRNTTTIVVIASTLSDKMTLEKLSSSMIMIQASPMTYLTTFILFIDHVNISHVANFFIKVFYGMDPNDRYLAEFNS